MSVGENRTKGWSRRKQNTDRAPAKADDKERRSSHCKLKQPIKSSNPIDFRNNVQRVELVAMLPCELQRRDREPSDDVR